MWKLYVENFIQQGMEQRQNVTKQIAFSKLLRGRETQTKEQKY
jgi:hypothetical protein